MEKPDLEDFGKHVFKGKMVENGYLGSHIFGGEYFWNDVGTLDDFRLANIEVARGAVKGLKTPYNYDPETNTAYGKGFKKEGADIKDCVIGSGVTISRGKNHGSKNISINGSFIGDNVEIYGTDVTDSVIDDSSVILMSKGLDHVAIGEKVKLSHGTEIDSVREENPYRIIFPSIQVENTKVIKKDLVYGLQR
jgi:NDP-sugar pyrophosphorylase family protein